MQGFKVCSTIDEIELKKFPISSQTVLIGDLLEQVVGATTWSATTAASIHYSRKFIAYEAASSSATEVLGYEVRGNERVEAQSSQVGSATNNGDALLLTDKNTVNNASASTAKEACFVQDAVGNTYSGTTTTYSIFGRILVGDGLASTAT